jgi:hypothetical protein
MLFIYNISQTKLKFYPQQEKGYLLPEKEKEDCTFSMATRFLVEL